MINFNFKSDTNTTDAVLKVILVICVVSLQTFIIYWCWNNFFVGAIDGVKEIGFFQAMFIKAMISVLTSKDINVESKV
jgi:hypothetical protein